MNAQELTRACELLKERNSASALQNEMLQTPRPLAMTERHYTIQELADQWHFGYSTVWSWFRDEPGVLKCGSTSTRRRTKVSLRVPESVAMRVYAQRTK